MDSEKHAAGEHLTGRETLTAESAQEWFDVADLARRFKTSRRTIYRLADCGRMPWGVKFGQLRRWSRRGIEEWEKGGCRPVRVVGAGAR
ncbi:MAG: helix-turn-helix domain-containing protein [Phycisphaerae bacterium]